MGLSVPDTNPPTYSRWLLSYLVLHLQLELTSYQMVAIVDYLMSLIVLYREGLAIDADISIPAERVIRSLDRIIEWRGKPKCIRPDNGSEYISHKLAAWAKKNDIKLCFIQPSNPQQNTYIECFNRTVRYDWLNQ